MLPRGDGDTSRAPKQLRRRQPGPSRTAPTDGTRPSPLAATWTKGDPIKGVSSSVEAPRETSPPPEPAADGDGDVKERIFEIGERVRARYAKGPVAYGGFVSRVDGRGPPH